MASDDKPGDAVFCTNLNWLKSVGFDPYEDEEYVAGYLLYKVGVIEENQECDGYQAK
jgi:hypothetical protein